MWCWKEPKGDGQGETFILAPLASLSFCICCQLFVFHFFTEVGTQVVEETARD